MPKGDDKGFAILDQLARDIAPLDLPAARRMHQTHVISCQPAQAGAHLIAFEYPFIPAQIGQSRTAVVSVIVDASSANCKLYRLA